MSIVRFIVGVIGFCLVWFVVAVVVGIGVMMIFPSDSPRSFVGIGLDRWSLPGTILGLLAGIQSFRASIKKPTKPKQP